MALDPKSLIVNLLHCIRKLPRVFLLLPDSSFRLFSSGFAQERRSCRLWSASPGGGRRRSLCVECIMRYQFGDPELVRVYAPALLISESAQEHDFLLSALQQQIQPITFVEHLWVADLIVGEHEMLRLRQCKTRIIRAYTSQALQNLLRLVTEVRESEQIDDLVAKWFTNKAAKRAVIRVLRKFGLDEGSIDAEAVRLSMADIAPLDRRSAELELRRDRILRQIEDYRAGLAIQIVKKLDYPPDDVPR